MQLSALAASDPKLAVVGAIKETGVADAELLKFYESYFKHSIYKDDRWKIYKAMGGRTLTWPQLITGALRSEKRYKRKGIENKKFGGDLHMQGGVLIFDKRGRLRYAYQEEYGYELDMDVIHQAIAEIRHSMREDATTRSLQCSSVAEVSEHYLEASECSTVFETFADYPDQDNCPCDIDADRSAI